MFYFIQEKNRAEKEFWAGLQIANVKHLFRFEGTDEDGTDKVDAVCPGGPSHNKIDIAEGSSHVESPQTSGSSSSDNNLYAVTRLDLFFLIVTPFLYVFDIASDVWVAVKHYNNGDTSWMSLTIVFIAAPNVAGFMIGCIIGYNMCRKREYKYPSLLFFILPVGMIYW